MATPLPFIRLSFGGTTADQNEIWSCGHTIIGAPTSGSPNPWFDDVASHIDELGQLAVNFVGDPSARVPNNAKIFWIKLALIGTDGKYMREPVMAPLNWGGSVNAPYSPQDALVLTFVSTIWRGAGKYNRLYLPTAGPAGTNAWALSQSEQNGFLDAALNYVRGINEELAEAGTPGSTRVGVVSTVRDGSVANAENLMVGRIVDTQRRRRNKLNEN